MKITAALGTLLLAAACAGSSSPAAAPTITRAPSPSPAATRPRPSPTSDVAGYAAAVCASWGTNVLHAITTDGDVLAATQRTVTVADSFAAEPPPGLDTRLRNDLGIYLTALANGASPTNRHAASVTHDCQSR